jgi:hypothetical protein
MKTFFNAFAVFKQMECHAEFISASLLHITGPSSLNLFYLSKKESVACGRAIRSYCTGIRPVSASIPNAKNLSEPGFIKASLQSLGSIRAIGR